MAITDRSIGQLIESTITITTISSQEPVRIRTADRTPAWVAMEDLLQEVQLQLQHQQMLIEHHQMLIEQQQQSIMTLREMMHEQDHEQQQQWILMQELGRHHQESIMQVRKQMLQYFDKQTRGVEQNTEKQQGDLAKQQWLQASAIGDCQLRLMVQDRRISALETSASTLMRKQLQLVREQPQPTPTTSPTTPPMQTETNEISQCDVPNETSSS